MEIDKSMKILVVDDQQTMRRVIASALDYLGFKNIKQADDGSTALPMLVDENDYDFLISDWNMPEMQGIDLLKKVRADEKLKDLPVLMLTAEAKSEQIVAAAKAGVNDYLIKPFNIKSLDKKISKIFSKL